MRAALVPERIGAILHGLKDSTIARIHALDMTASDDQFAAVLNSIS